MFSAIFYSQPKFWGYQTIFGLGDLECERPGWDEWMETQRALIGSLASPDNALIVGTNYYSDQTSTEAQDQAWRVCAGTQTRVSPYSGTFYLDGVVSHGDESRFTASIRLPINQLIDLEYAVDVASLAVLVDYVGLGTLDDAFEGLGGNTGSEVIIDRLLARCKEIVTLGDDGNVTSVMSRQKGPEKYATWYRDALKGVFSLSPIVL